MTLSNFSAGTWHTPSTATQDVVNPATGELLAKVPLSSASDVDAVVQAAVRAADGWRRTPPTERIQYLFAFKQALEAHFEEIARTITMECGKTIGEARGELRRGIENVEVATGIPSMAMGYNVEDIASGIDEMMIRQPLGVVAAITPFNFPGMIPLWFMPYALACGNCFILKPSERVPMTMHRVFELLDRPGLPPGVGVLENAGKEYVYARHDPTDNRGKWQGGA
jgi:malonate-semialdehyde dehydrogenase (acetylating)/methylmalonate-semialdehyde dehydrogenase